MTGTVYKSTGSWYFVKSESGLFYRCRIKGKFRLKGIKSTNPIAVGDEVEFDIETKGDEEVGVIKLIHERKNYIVRKSVNLSKQTQIIASNIDLAFLLITINNPTLLNAIEPGLNLKTKQISDQHQQGQHTTTFAEMFDLSFDAKIIDTPGIKGFGVVAIEKEELGDYFTEFFALKSGCKFHNCIHVNEPQCAVKDALEDEKISWSRYKSYLQILEGEEENYRTDIWE